MANLSDNLDYRNAFDKAQKLYVQLYGYQGYSGMGLADEMDRIANEKGEDSLEYKTIKAKFDSLKKQYDAIKKKTDDLYTQLTPKKLVAAEDNSKAVEVSNLEKLRDSSKRRGDTETANSLQQQIDTLKPSVAPVVDANMKAEGTEGFDYSKYAINAKGNAQNAEGSEVLFVVEPDKNGNNKVSPYTSASEASKAFVKAYYGMPNGIEKLKKDLLASNYITDKQYKENDYANGITAYLSDYSRRVVQDTTIGGAKTAPSMSSFMGTMRGSGTGAAKQYRTITTRGDAKKMLDEYLVGLTGSPSTPEQEQEFFNQLHTAENKAVITQKDGTTMGSNLSDADRLFIAAKVAGKALKGTDVDALLKSNSPGQLASDIQSLTRTAAEYGVPLTAQEAMLRLAGNLGQKDYVKAQQERIKQTAMAVHPYLKDHIAAGGNVKDVADVYAQQYAQKMGKVIPVSTADRNIMNAIAQNKTLDQFDKDLQALPEYAYTDEAHQRANDFTKSFLQSWGLVG